MTNATLRSRSRSPTRYVRYAHVSVNVTLVSCVTCDRAAIADDGSGGTTTIARRSDVRHIRYVNVRRHERCETRRNAVRFRGMKYIVFIGGTAVVVFVSTSGATLRVMLSGILSNGEGCL